MGGYDEAKKYADKLMSYKSLGVDKFSSKYYAAAEIVMLTEGDKEKARAILDQGWSVSDRDKAVVRQAFEEFYRSLGLEDAWPGEYTMKAYKQKQWQHIITGTEGNTILFGVNIFDYEWKDTGKRASVKDPLYGQEFMFPIYRVKINNVEY